MTEFFTEFWSNFTRPENIVGHIAYVLLITSMLMRSMNWLRALAILSGAISATFYFTLADYVSMFWEALFSLVNAGQLLILQIENRRGTFSEDEDLFIKTCLPDIERAHARKLVKLGAWTEVGEDTVLITEDTCPENLKFIVRGAAHVTRDARTLGKVGPGDFLGEMSYLTNQTASATVTTSETVRYLAFNRHRLKAHLERNSEVRHALEASFNRNLVTKLAKSNETPQPAR
ncbi:MAG: cyclic nucleotide-binding domain-containing protein [Rhizobiaceae bacterium]|nr:cyclic nucleotide-binding domain-containing protein [Rhizobiaceae bacterium]